MVSIVNHFIKSTTQTLLYLYGNGKHKLRGFVIVVMQNEKHYRTLYLTVVINYKINTVLINHHFSKMHMFMKSHWEIQSKQIATLLAFHILQVALYCCWILPGTKNKQLSFKALLLLYVTSVDWYRQYFYLFILFYLFRSLNKKQWNLCLASEWVFF